MIKNISVFVLTYLLILGPSLVSFDFFWIAHLLTLPFACIYIHRIFLHKNHSLLLLSIIFTLLCFGLIKVILNSNDITPLYTPMKLLVFLLNANFLSQLYFEVFKRKSIRNFLIHLNYCVLITVSIVLIFFVFPEFRNSAMKSLDFKLATAIEVKDGIRAIDLSLGGGTLLSIFFVVGYVLLDELLRKGILSGFSMVLLKFLLILVTLLTARTGFILLLVYIITNKFIAPFECLREKDNSKKQDIINMCASIFAFLCLVYIIYDYWTILTENVFPWAFEFVYSYLDSGTVSTASTNSLLTKHYDIKFSETDILLGGGLNNISSDVGYIRIIAELGMLGLISFFIFYASSVLSSFISYKDNYQKELWILSKLTFVFGLIIILVNLKELLWVNSRGVFFLFFTLVFFINNKCNMRGK